MISETSYTSLTESIEQSSPVVEHRIDYLFYVIEPYQPKRPKRSKVCVKKQDAFKTWALVKNLQFLSNSHETW